MYVLYGNIYNFHLTFQLMACFVFRVSPNFSDFGLA